MVMIILFALICLVTCKWWAGQRWPVKANMCIQRQPASHQQQQTHHHKYIYKYHTNTYTNIKRAGIQQQPASTNINKLTTSVKLSRLASLESAAAANPALLAFSKPSQMAVAQQISQWLVVHFFWDTESALVFDPLKLPGPLYHHQHSATLQTIFVFKQARANTTEPSQLKRFTHILYLYIYMFRSQILVDEKVHHLYT